MAGATAPDRLDRLRTAIETVRHFQFDPGKPPLTLGERADAMLGGGLAFGVLHETAPERPFDFGAATGFTLALAALAAKRGGETLWVQTDPARWEGGTVYGPGLDSFGLASHRLLVLRARRTADALLAMEEALKCRAVASVIAEVPDAGTDLTVTRRLALAAREQGGLGLLLRHRACTTPSAVATRWSVAASPGARDEYGGIGVTSFQLSLMKNRRGACGRLNMAWDHDACVFLSDRAGAAHSVAVAAASADRPARAAFA